MKVSVNSRATPFTAPLTNAGGVVSPDVLLVTALPEKPGTSFFALSASFSRFVPGVYPTVTTSRLPPITSASVSVTVVSLTATGFVSARLTVSPPTVTAKSLAAGTEPAASSSAPSKVMVSVEPLTAAEEKAGGVWLATDLRWKEATRLPDRSRSRRSGCEDWL